MNNPIKGRQQGGAMSSGMRKMMRMMEEKSMMESRMGGMGGIMGMMGMGFGMEEKMSVNINLKNMKYHEVQDDLDY